MPSIHCIPEGLCCATPEVKDRLEAVVDAVYDKFGRKYQREAGIALKRAIREANKTDFDRGVLSAQDMDVLEAAAAKVERPYPPSLYPINGIRKTLDGLVEVARRTSQITHALQNLKVGRDVDSGNTKTRLLEAFKYFVKTYCEENGAGYKDFATREFSAAVYSANQTDGDSLSFTKTDLAVIEEAVLSFHYIRTQSGRFPGFGEAVEKIKRKHIAKNELNSIPVCHRCEIK